MQHQRYAFTALIAVLMWLFSMSLFKLPLFFVAQAYPMIAIILASSLFASTLVGIWFADGFFRWSEGTADLNTIGILARMRIAGTAALLFCFPLKMILGTITTRPFGYFELLSSEGLFVICSVWTATLIVDALVHQRKT